MRTVAIIAEYNPFHLGHAYQYELIRERFGANTKCIIIMSPGFVQRGEPAILHELPRAQMALAAGASLVLSMPFVFATSSARYFATAGVQILSRIGICTDLACGAEDVELEELFDFLAEVLSEESEEYKLKLQAGMRAGYNLGEARQESLKSIYPERSEAIEKLLQKSNNILALEYLIAIKKENIIRENKGLRPLKLHLLPRIGQENTYKLHSGTSVSASAIRHTLRNEKDSLKLIQALEGVIPAGALAKLLGQTLIRQDSLRATLPYILRGRKDEEQTQYRDMDRELAARIRKTASGNLQDASSKNYPISRVNRAILAWILGLLQEDWNLAAEEGPQFTRVLAFDRDGRYLLKLMRKHAHIRLINKDSDFHENKGTGQTGPWQEKYERLAMEYFRKLMEENGF